MNQEKKAIIASKIKPILKKYNVKGSLSVRNHMSICLTITQGPIDFGDDNVQVNPYWYQEHFEGKAKQFLSEIVPAMYSANYYDNSDAMTDYFDTAYYVSVNIGKWNKPYSIV